MLNVSLNAIGILIQFSMMICKTLESLMLLFLTFYLYSQGTGAVTLSCVMSAIGITKTKLCDQRFIIYGAGSAGLGITKQLRDAMVATDGTPEEEANAKFWLIDKHGLIRQSTPDVREDLRAFIRSDEEWTSFTGEVGLLDTVKQIKPTVLIGCSTHAGAFTEEVVKTMAAHCGRPIILPLSNPSRLVEVNPGDANEWTRGKALLATGSPFPPAKMPNGKDYIIAECNSMSVSCFIYLCIDRPLRCADLSRAWVWCYALPVSQDDRHDDYRGSPQTGVFVPGIERSGRCAFARLWGRASGEL